MIQYRPSVMTLNLWNDQRWQQREAAVKKCLETLRPDVLCLQELRASTREHLDSFLPEYNRVTDEFPGWTCEGNIYWKQDMFREIEHGIEDVDILEEHRRLFWVRLSLEAATERSLLVSTAHFTYQRHPIESETGQSPRLEQTRQTVNALNEVSREREPVLFMGDLNDTTHPHAILNDTGYTDCFSELNLPVRPTFPARPTKRGVDGGIERPLDWIFANRYARSIGATVPQFHYDDFAPSDHWPVLAVYELE